MQTQYGWTRLQKRGHRTPWTSIHSRQTVVHVPGSVARYGTVSAVVERLSEGTYSLQVIAYPLRPDGIIDTERGIVIETGIEFSLNAARLRAEAAVKRGMSTLHAMAQQEVQA